MTLGNRPTYAVAEKTIACKVDDESELYDRFAEYEEDFGNRSQALRAAMRAATDEDDGGQEWNTFEDVILTTASVLAGVALFLPLTAFLGLLDTTFVIGVGAAYVALSAGLAFAVDRGVFRSSSSTSTAPDAAEEVST